MTWVGDGLQLVTTGFSESGMSEVVLRDLRNVSAVVGSVSLPQCVNTLQPFSTGSLLLLAGRGDPMFLTIDPLTLSTLTKSPQGSDQLDCLQSLPFAQNTRQMALLDAPAAGPNEVARFVRLTEDSRLHSVSVVSKEAPKCVRLSTASPLTSTAEVTRWLQDTRQAEVLRCKSALSRPHLSEALLSQHRDLTSTRFPASPRVGPRQFLFGGKSPSTSPSPVGSPPLPPLSLTYSLPSPSTIASPTHRVRSTPASPKTLSRSLPPLSCPPTCSPSCPPSCPPPCPPSGSTRSPGSPLLGPSKHAPITRSEATGKSSNRLIQELCGEVRELKKTVEEQSKQIQVGIGNAGEK